mmetsp:Transcript_4422/g.7719  ORF Transcript_4422/g.7719 Transcript_4422/m.7719 type:complete len:214 (-) Transcript_4422:126-767(-)|eukprot:CAMPEP_0197459462 /NCGR_PEP_ID=MMETSP1175-20131217/51537_1 /TAXON_ID=1003142 /ORGANISM="Triceratium dubium, Strain CCMP147" /LENGTH=213 /DNA_ID=CAMNT_0042994351 /DNA_START=309 /DNA_END=950 /DNA_ORIENTATION=-
MKLVATPAIVVLLTSLGSSFESVLALSTRESPGRNMLRGVDGEDKLSHLPRKLSGTDGPDQVALGGLGVMELVDDGSETFVVGDSTTVRFETMTGSTSLFASGDDTLVSPHPVITVTKFTLNVDNDPQYESVLMLFDVAPHLQDSDDIEAIGSGTFESGKLVRLRAQLSAAKRVPRGALRKPEGSVGPCGKDRFGKLPAGRRENFIVTSVTML